VTGAVFKTVEVRISGLAGSIPVRLRQPFKGVPVPHQSVRLTQYARGGGCACRIPPGERDGDPPLLRENLKAVDLELTEDEVAEIEGVIPLGGFGDRYGEYASLQKAEAATKGEVTT